MAELSSFEKFGNYLLLERIASGGMAAIFLARPVQLAASGRILIIKRILPQVATQDEFLRMFQSETEICMGLNHPNLVQIHDFGQIDGQPYIAMEYVEGKGLDRLIRSRVPVSMAVSIATQAAAGLHHAHTAQNRCSGEPLNIIHRDVSPQNILLSYDGNVKLIDFGIAKAQVNSAQATRPGCIKGKLCYLSPEQARGEELDLRSDVFSLGVVLWELLTGRKLFDPTGRSELDVLDAIHRCDETVFKPSALNIDVPAELDAVVLKALSQKRESRFQSAEEFQRALRKFMVSHIPGYSYSDVARQVQVVFQKEMMEERMYLRFLNERAQKFLCDEPTSTGLQALPEGMTGAASEAATPKKRRFPVRISGASVLVFLGLQIFTFGLRELEKRYSLLDRIKVPDKLIRLANSEPGVLLKIDVQPPSKPSELRIFLDQDRVDPAFRVAQVKTDQPFTLRVERRGFVTWQKSLRLNAEGLKGAKSYTLDVQLKRRRR